MEERIIELYTDTFFIVNNQFEIAQFDTRFPKWVNKFGKRLSLML